MWKCRLPFLSLVVSWRLCGPAVPGAAFARKWERFNSIQYWAASMTNSLTRLASLILTEVYPLFVRFLGNDSTSKYLPNRICQVDFNFNPKHNLVKASTLIQRLLLQVNNFLIYKWRRMGFLTISWQPNLLKPLPEHAATIYFPVRSKKSYYFLTYLYNAIWPSAQSRGLWY